MPPQEVEWLLATVPFKNLSLLGTGQMPHPAHLSHYLSLVGAILVGQVKVACLQEDT